MYQIQKRLISLLLVFSFVFSVIPANALATEIEVEDSYSEQSGNFEEINETEIEQDEVVSDTYGSYSDDINKESVVAYTNISVENITLDSESLTLTAGGEVATLVATVLPEDASNKDVTWTSSDMGVATVADGVVTPVSEGSTTITATAGGFSAECSVTVSAGNVAVTGVTLDKKELALTVGVAETLTATVTPENATSKDLIWTSSAEAVATVENGVVTPVAMGTTTITVTTEDGVFSDTCAVTVWGVCGDTTKWFVDGSKLIIQGTGKIGDFASAPKQPWGSVRSKITEIELGAEITDIGNFSFTMFSKLTTLTIPESSKLQTIGKNAFMSTSKLTAITLPNTLTSIVDTNVANKEIHFRGTASEWEALNYTGNKDVYVLDAAGNEVKYVPDPYNGKCGTDATWHFDPDTGTLTISGTGAMKDYGSASDTPWYQHQENLKKVIVQSGITSIGNKAFQSYTALETVELAESVTEIGDYAFQGVGKLATIDLSHVTSIGEYTFEKCTALTAVELDAATTIGRNAFYGCTELKSASLGNSKTTLSAMGIRAFEGCSSLETVTFTNVTSIGQYAFKDTAVKSVDLSSVTVVDGSAFSGAKSLETVIFGEKLATLGGSAFENTAIKEITIPASVMTWGNGTFSGCKSLTTATIAANVTELPRASFQNCEKLTTISLPATITTVKDNAFNGCVALAAVNFTGNWNNVTIEKDNDPLKKAVGIVDVTSVTLDKTELALTAGGEVATLVATVLPEDASNKDVTWTSSDMGVATVADGVVTPVSEGSTTITATAGGFSAECSVTVSAGNVAVTGVTLDKKELALTVGAAETLTATVIPENATSKDLIWTSSAEAVATVENGVVTAVSIGTATITVKTKDGNFTAKCVVTVSASNDVIDLTQFVFQLSNLSSDAIMGNGTLSVRPAENNTYLLDAPIDAISGNAATTLTITAPSGFAGEFDVTYTTWNNDDGGSHCFGEKTETSTGGKITLTDYFNSLAMFEQKLEYSDLVIGFEDSSKEYAVKFELYNELQRLFLYPTNSGISEKLEVIKTGKNELSATVYTGVEYTIFARGGYTTGGAIPESKLSISEVDGSAVSTVTGSEANLTFTAEQEGTKEFEIRITNDSTNPNIKTGIYKLHLTVKKASENPLSFTKFTATLNGEDVVLDTGIYQIKEITQYDELTITAHFDNAGDNVSYIWECGAGLNKFTLDETSPTLTVDTSYTQSQYYIFTCTAVRNEEKIKSTAFRVKRVTILEIAAPTITKQPTSAQYQIGAIPETLIVEVAGVDYYQWYVNTEPKFETATPIEGETKYYYVPSTANVGTLYYCCEVYIVRGDIVSPKTQSDFAKIEVSASDIPWSGTGSAENPFILSTENDLIQLQKNVGKGKNYSGVYFQLINDITLSEGWKSIGSTKDGSGNGLMGKNVYPFSGVLDGNGHTITIASGGKPLFGYVRQATIKNLNIKGAKIDGYGLIDNYDVDYGDIGVYDPNNVPETVTITNCHILDGTTIKNSGFLGGYASGSNIVRISSCSIAKDVVIGYGMTEDVTGSFAGQFNGYVDNCTSAATVTGTQIVGGLVGCKGQSMGPCAITNSSFTGTVTSNGDAGGILGGGYHAGSAPNSPCVTITDCRVSGDVTGKGSVGGILGSEGKYIVQCWENGIGVIRNNEFTGNIHATGTNVGGIVGFICSLNVCNRIENNYYAPNSGAERGIGFVKYVDTSCASHETQSGATYFDTSKELPDVADVAFKNLNRTDDPLGEDKEKLCYTEKRTKAYVTELTISGTYKTEYLVGDELDTTGIILVAKWSDGTTTNPSVKDASITGFDSTVAGSGMVTIEYEGIMASFTINIKPKSQKITVSITVMGDSHHSDPTSNGGPHGLARGGLTTWASVSSLEADATETVWDVIQRVAKSNNLSIQTSFSEKYNSYYIEAINGLGEFDNGNESGWMYTVNGTHPNVGISARYVKDQDVIILHYTDDYTYEQGGVNYGKPVGQAAAEAVDKLIAAIGTVSYTDESKAKIDAARKAYDALSDSEKKLVTKLSVLEAAEKKYAELKKADDQKQATAVDNLIAAIGTVTKNSGTKINAAWNAYNALTADQKALVKKLTALQSATRTWNELLSKEVIDLIDKIDDPVTESSKDAIEAARTAYDKLTADQKKLVTNYEKLTKAETELAKLTATEEDKKKAQEVIDMIDKLGDITADSEKDVEAARKAYDALTDLQKKLVENYDKLEAAESKLKLMKAMGKVTDPYIATGDYMINLGTPGIGSVGGEWMVIGLARSDRNIPNVEDYYNSVVKYVQENIDENERLHKAKSTDNSRMILALTAIGKDVTDVDGHNLLTGLNSMDYIKKQGNNGPIWALIALDSGNYPVPEGDVTRKALIDEILSVQTSDGGWAISGDEADADMTGMALTALAPYYKKDLNVLAAVDKAIECLSQMQDADGGFSTFSGDGGKVATSESTAQVIVALTALGINPDTDSRFIKNGNSAVDALIAYFVNGGGFKHIMTGERDGMATEQAYYALTAYYRFLEEKTRLYDMTDVINMGGDPEEIVAETTEPTVPATTEPVEANDNGSFPWAIMVLVLAAGFGGGIATVTLVLPRIKKKRS